MSMLRAGAARALLTGLLSVTAANWPGRPLTLVVGAPDGGGPDTSARVIADQMDKATGQRVLVDNKPGVTGNIAAEQVLRSGARLAPSE